MAHQATLWFSGAAVGSAGTRSGESSLFPEQPARIGHTLPHRAWGLHPYPPVSRCWPCVPGLRLCPDTNSERRLWVCDTNSQTQRACTAMLNVRRTCTDIPGWHSHDHIHAMTCLERWLDMFVDTRATHTFRKTVRTRPTRPGTRPTTTSSFEIQAETHPKVRHASQKSRHHG